MPALVHTRAKSVQDWIPPTGTPRRRRQSAWAGLSLALLAAPARSPRLPPELFLNHIIPFLKPCYESSPRPWDNLEREWALVQLANTCRAFRSWIAPFFARWGTSRLYQRALCGGWAAPGKDFTPEELEVGRARFFVGVANDRKRQQQFHSGNRYTGRGGSPAVADLTQGVACM